MALFGLFKKKEKDKDEFSSGKDPFASGSDPFASENFDSGSDPFASQGGKGGFDLSQKSEDLGLAPEPVQPRRPSMGMHEPQPVPQYQQYGSSGDVSKDVEVLSSKVDALRSQVESVSIKLDHIETLIRNQAEASKQRW